MSMVAAPRLMSPNRRRIVDVVSMGAAAVKQLRGLGWKDYEGPAEATTALDEQATPEVFDAMGIEHDPEKDVHTTGYVHIGTRNGWVIPGTDPIVDAERLTITGMATLGDGRRRMGI